MADPTIIELIELRARGIADINLQIDKLKDSIGKTTDAQTVYAKALQDPVYAKNMRTLEQMRMANRDLYKIEQQRAALGYRQQQGVNNLSNRARIYEELKLKRDMVTAERDVQRLQMAATTMRANSRFGMSDAAANQKFLREQEAAQRAVARNELAVAAHRARSFAGLEDGRAQVEMRRREDQVKALQERNRLTARLEASGTPAAVRDARLRLDIERKIDQLRKAEERTMNQARYGRWGAAFMGGLQSSGARLIGGTATAGAAMVGASAMAGFSDTVEMNTFRNQLMFLNREIAGAFRPAMMEATAGLRILRFGFESMSAKQQKLFATTTLVIGGLGALNLLLSRMTGMGLVGWTGQGVAALNNARTASSMGQYGAFAKDLGPAAASYAGVKTAGSMAAWIPLLAKISTIGTGAYAGYELTSGKRDLPVSDLATGMAGSFGGPLGALNQVGRLFSDDPLRSAWNWGVDRVENNMPRNRSGYQDWHMGERPLGSLRDWGERQLGWRAELPPAMTAADKEAEKKRSRVTPMLPTLYSEAGGTYEEVALAVANKAAADKGEDKTELGKILELLQNTIGREKPNNPPPM